MTGQPNEKRIEQLKKYYAAQAGWTKAARTYLYRRTGLPRAKAILEVGCGTGEVTAELLERTRAQVTAVDLDDEAVSCTARRCPQAQVVQADACSLGFPPESFDAAVCHFTLMWCPDPAPVVVGPGAAIADRAIAHLALVDTDSAAQSTGISRRRRRQAESVSRASVGGRCPRAGVAAIRAQARATRAQHARHGP